ncbi:MAG TPA: histidine--tRNA ligase [Candidatus Limnocylindrales bacterium]|nr:histidine--tRNA ligase [Candidatus Limnocylindrales bacterium]
MPRFQAPRGTRDLLPVERGVLLRLEDTARALATRYGYQPIETPLFEQSAVFERGVGEVTDVVEKELFRVQAGRGDEERERWALRPEPTAGIVRAYVQHGLRTWTQPVRLSMTGPMFRYDRPQAGRYRQFWQFDVEAIGDAGPGIDAEIIELATAFLAAVGLPDVQVRLNSIGDAACRPAYVDALRAYFGAHEAELPVLERHRLQANPLRLLDSKDERMTPLIDAAPAMSAYLCSACRAHFDGLLAHLESLSITPRLVPSLVRGLDYYTRTAFELYRPGAEGQQQALGGGGRYDGLVELLGGQRTPGIGFGIGLDRVALALAEQDTVAAAEGWRPSVVVVGVDAHDTAVRLQVATELRGAGLACWPDLSGRRLSKQLEGASKAGAHFAVICGDELEAGNVQVRDLKAGTQRQVAVTDLARDLLRAQTQHRHGEEG